MPSPSFVIDVVPLAVAFSLLMSGLSLIVLLLTRRGPTHVRMWAAGGVLVSTSVLLILLRGAIPDLVSVLLANLGLIAAYYALAVGTEAYFGRRHDLETWLFVPLSGIFIVIYFAAGDLDARIVGHSLPIAIFSAIILYRFCREGNWRGSFGAQAAIASSGISMLVGTFRLVVAAAPFAPLPPDSVNTAVLGMSVLGTIGMAILVVILSVGLVLGKPAVAGASPEPAAPTGGSLGDAPALEAREAAAPNWQLASDRRALVTPAGEELKLTGNEYLVLQRLGGADAEGLVSREVLNVAIGRAADNPKDRNIDILISRLRRKCVEAGHDLPVTSVRGRGYVFHGDLRVG